jgi:hypothetical protein
MTPPLTPKTSARLARAAKAERGELRRHRDRLLSRRKSLQDELAQTERGLAELEERMTLLNRLAPLEQAPQQPEDADAFALLGSATAGARRAEMLRGTAIRETAVRLLAQSSDAVRPIHYRRLYEMLSDAGFTVAGKDPLATFLTQLSRSPVMRKTTKAGIYELDRDAPERLRRKLGQLQTELRDVTGNPASTEDLAAIRQRREQVLSDFAHTERALEEAARVLGSSAAGLNAAEERGAA